MTMHCSTFDRLIPGALAPSAVTGVALVAVALLCVPAALTAQAHIAGDHEPHLFAAADFGIDPTGVTFTKDIAPNPGTDDQIRYVAITTIEYLNSYS